ncbi:Ycf48-like protein [Stieleria maiorica]|uniref:Ycf48-like protein n=1 Tax=Stieleria maiorica TaxID=2795974 RepID=A0A5B9MNU1_9BACT|nr:hypothetical protein [Stieleria maiorica]QEG00498.1 Ycf48-like protein [Stieleria maiorica]
MKHVVYTIVATTLAVISPAHAQDFTNVRDTLRSLPPIQAAPITSSIHSKGVAPEALTPPDYCDGETLRDSATVRAIRFADQRRGVAVGDHGSILVTRDGGESWSAVESGVQCRLNDAVWVDAQRVIAIGGGVDVVTRISRGVVLVSHDAGASWRRSADSELPLLRTIQYQSGEEFAGGRRPAIAAIGAPDPITGATSFQSRDGGRSWQSTLDPQPDASLPSQRLSSRNAATADQSAMLAEAIQTRSVVRTFCRLDGRTMLCAGDHGNIFRSTDGGQSWAPVRRLPTEESVASTPSEPSSCALLVIAANEDQIPWSLIGRETLEKRWRCNLIVGTADGREMHALDQAAMQLGVAAVDTFRESDTAASLATLRRWIDVHRPPILALAADLPQETQSALLQHAVAGGTEKVVQYANHGQGETLLHDSAMLPDCGVLAGDFAEDSLMLVADFDLHAGPDLTNNPWVAINTRYSSGSQSVRGDSLGVGVRLARGHRLPPRKSRASHRRLQVIQGRLKQQTAIKEMLALETNKFVSTMRRLLDQTSREDQFRSAWSIARQSIAQTNRITVWDEISRRFDDSSAAQLLKLHARARQHSREWDRHPVSAIRLDSSGQPHVHTGSNAISADVRQSLPETAQELFPTRGGHAAIVSPFQSHTALSNSAGLSNSTGPMDSQSGVIQASATVPLAGGRGGGLLTPLRQTGSKSDQKLDLAWQMHPVRLIAEDAFAQRQRGGPEPTRAESSDEDVPAEMTSQQDFSADVRRIADRQSPWSSLLQSASDQVAVAVATPSPPRLDGLLDESFWNADHARAALTRGATPSKLRFSWDDQFIYVAMQIPAAEFASTDESGPVGRRDADLRQSDRVILGLDIDRDLLTAMHLGFTRDGRTHDDLDGSDHWNPTWYVATHRSEEGVVTAEIAIEQNGLGTTVRAGDSWFIESRSIAAGRPRHYPLMPDPLTRVRVDFR